MDTGRHPEHTQRVLDFAKATGEPIRAIINSHWHLDHVGGNVLLRQAYPGVEVYATSAIDAALNGFLTGYHAQLQECSARKPKPIQPPQRPSGRRSPDR